MIIKNPNIPKLLILKAIIKSVGASGIYKWLLFPKKLDDPIDINALSNWNESPATKVNNLSTR